MNQYSTHGRQNDSPLLEELVALIEQVCNHIVPHLKEVLKSGFMEDLDPCHIQKQGIGVAKLGMCTIGGHDSIGFVV